MISETPTFHRCRCIAGNTLNVSICVIEVRLERKGQRDVVVLCVQQHLLAIVLANPLSIPFQFNPFKKITKYVIIPFYTTPSQSVNPTIDTRTLEKHQGHGLTQRPLHLLTPHCRLRLLRLILPRGT